MRTVADALDLRAAVGRRVRVQVHSAKTGYSTTVDLPFRFVCPVGTKIVDTPKGPREVGVCLRPPTLKDFVVENVAAFAVRRRQAIAEAAKRNPTWVGRAAPTKGPAKGRGSAKKAPPAARKPKTARKPKVRQSRLTEAPAAPLAERSSAVGALAERAGQIAG